MFIVNFFCLNKSFQKCIFFNINKFLNFKWFTKMILKSTKTIIKRYMLCKSSVILKMNSWTDDDGLSLQPLMINRIVWIIKQENKKLLMTDKLSSDLNVHRFHDLFIFILVFKEHILKNKFIIWNNLFTLLSSN